MQAIEQRFVAIELFVDGLRGAPDAFNKRMTSKAEELLLVWFNDIYVPAFAIVSPDGKSVLCKFTGSDDRESFVKFLDEGWARWQELAGKDRGKLTEREMGLLKK